MVIGLTNGENGLKIGARVSEITGTIGARRADENKFDLTVAVEQDKELPLVVNNLVFDAIFTPAS
jgi:di/tripeptidase